MKLPKDVILYIFSFLPYKDIVKYKILSKKIYKELSSPIFIHNFYLHRDNVMNVRLSVLFKDDEKYVELIYMSSYEDSQNLIREIIFIYEDYIKDMFSLIGSKIKTCFRNLDKEHESIYGSEKYYVSFLSVISFLKLIKNHISIPISHRLS